MGGDWHSDNEREHRIARSQDEKIKARIAVLYATAMDLLKRLDEVTAEREKLRSQCNHSDQTQVPTDDGEKMRYPWVCVYCGKTL